MIGALQRFAPAAREVKSIVAESLEFGSTNQNLPLPRTRTVLPECCGTCTNRRQVRYRRLVPAVPLAYNWHQKKWELCILGKKPGKAHCAESFSASFLSFCWSRLVSPFRWLPGHSTPRSFTVQTSIPMPPAPCGSIWPRTPYRFPYRFTSRPGWTHPNSILASPRPDLPSPACNSKNIFSIDPHPPAEVSLDLNPGLSARSSLSLRSAA